MGNQMVLQIRVDSDLKEQVADIFDQIGVDIPTAVRMFFKATVREKGLPFEVAVERRKIPIVVVMPVSGHHGQIDDDEDEKEALKGAEYRFCKSRARNWSYDNQLGYMIINNEYNAVVRGNRYDLSLEETLPRIVLELNKYKIERNEDGTWRPGYAMNKDQKSIFAKLGVSEEDAHDAIKKIIV